MEYNTQRRRLPLPEYGRSVQNMVDYALTIEDRDERQRCAETIVNIMEGMFPSLRDMPDFKRKLWDHLAVMADFKLDIDYPYEVVKPEELEVKPEVIPYASSNIRYRHYGRILGEMIEKAVELEDEEERKQLVDLIAVRMKKSFIGWNKDGVEDQKILEDLKEYSKGKIDLKLEDLNMGPSLAVGSQFRNTGGHRRQSNGQRKQYNNQRKKH